MCGVGELFLCISAGDGRNKGESSGLTAGGNSAEFREAAAPRKNREGECMLRDRKIEEIFDGHFYTPDDLVPVGCSDCAGCSACCRNTGDTIILDPYDMYQLCRGTGRTFTDMIEREIEIRLVDGLILPNLMQHHEEAEETGQKGAGADTDGHAAAAESDDHCPFLSAAGRCTIHPCRPGMCRMYPMGRYYPQDREGFVYILQKDECTDREKTLVKLRDWLDIPDLARYEAFALDWHDFRKRAEKGFTRLTERSRESAARYILQIFYVHPYFPEMDFYPQYEVRRKVCLDALGQIL